MNLRKRKAALLLAAAMCVSFAGCKGEAQKTLSKPNTVNSMTNGGINSQNSSRTAQSVPEQVSKPEKLMYKATDEIMNAEFESGLIQMNNEVFQTGGYITVADFVEKYKDKYDITYYTSDGGKELKKQGTYDECKDYLLRYYGQDYVDTVTILDYALMLTPKSGEDPELRNITVDVKNFTSSDDEKTTLDKAIVVRYMMNDGMRVKYPENEGKDDKMCAWLSGGFGSIAVDLKGGGPMIFREMPEGTEMSDGKYSAKSLEELLKSKGYVFAEVGSTDISAYDKKMRVYNGSEADYLHVYCLGEPNLFNKRPVYYYTFIFDSNTDKIKGVSFVVEKFM